MLDVVRVRVLAFGSAVEALGWPQREVELPGDARLATLIERLEKDCPRMAEARRVIRYAVNRAYATPDTVLKSGDEVAVIPPVSGGASDADVSAADRDERAAARLTRAPIDLSALIREVEHHAAGGIATFAGVVRAEQRADGVPLVALDYTAYHEMALAELRQLVSAARQRRPDQRLVVVHRLGRLKLGETSVAVVVSSPHRAEAFETCRALIDELKQSAPIFKQELWQDGRSDWVSGV